MTLADRLIVLNGGAIEQIGAPVDVYDKPASTFVASFIGSPAMNLVPVRSENGRLQAESGTGLDAPNLHGADRYLLGVRPEHLEISSEKTQRPDKLSMEFTVNVLEPVGAESYIYGQLDGGRSGTRRACAKPCAL